MAKWRTETFYNYDDACRFAIKHSGQISGPFPSVTGRQTWIVQYYG